MAELGVFIDIAKLTVSISQLVLQGQQVKLAKHSAVLEDIGNRMSRIGDEILVIQGFLTEQDITNGDNALKIWIAQVRTSANRTQDLVDDYDHFLFHEIGFRFGDITRQILQNDRISSALAEFDKKLKRVEDDLTNLSERRKRWVQQMPNTRERSPHQLMGPRFVDEEQLVGIKENREKLVRLLQSEESALSVISVSGMGGLGKTTLVSNLYKRESPNFGCHAWVSISQSYKLDDILRELIKELYRDDTVPNDIQSMDSRKLEELLRVYLEHKRYLIILDDVWDPKTFHDLCDCLVGSYNHQGSRIIITTRIEDVASNANDGCKLQLKPLIDNEAWDLFRRKAFRKEKDHECPLKIEKCAKEIVTKCQGLPLAIVSLGRLLSSRQQTEEEWKRFYHQLNWELEGNTDLKDVKDTLHRSYKDLPANLKNCFLYCSMFPEGCLLRRKKVIRLWIAEGFVEERGFNALEEVAENYLNELIKLSILQVVSRNSFGRVKEFRVHHLMRELALLISRQTSFHTVYDNNATLNVDNDARRVAVWNCSKDIKMPFLRTFLSSGSSMVSSSFLSTNLSKSKHLTVLDLEGARIEAVADAITELFNLRYLCLRNSKVKSLPNSIGNLSHLEMLDLYGSMITQLPVGIVNLKKLRYLNVMEVQNDSGISPPESPNGLWDMKAFQTLKGVRACTNLVGGLKNMSQLRSLAICLLKDYHFTPMSDALSHMSLLSRLVLTINCYKHKALRLNEPREMLFFDGWLPNLPSLRELQLKGIDQDEITSACFFRRLGDVIDSMIEGYYEKQHLLFRDGWFPNLQSLVIEGFGCVNQVKMEQGTMVNLHTLVLKDLRNVRKVPLGMEFLTSLQKLNIIRPHTEFKASLQKSDVRHKFQHIPDICIE